MLSLAFRILIMEKLRHLSGMWLSWGPTVVLCLNQSWNSSSEAVLSSFDSWFLFSVLQTIVSYSKTHMYSTLICFLSFESWFRVLCLTKKVLVIFTMLFQRQRNTRFCFLLSLAEVSQSNIASFGFWRKIKRSSCPAVIGSCCSG